MEIRATPRAEIHAIDYEEFKRRVASGEIGPAMLVRDPLITNGEWWAANNLGIFHHVSPKSYPKGERLLAHIALEQRREQQLEQFVEQHIERVKNLPDPEAQFKLPDLTNLSRPDDVSGVCRFMRFSLEEPVFFVTITFRDKELEVNVVRSATAVKETLPSIVRNSFGPDGLYAVTPGVSFDMEAAQRGRKAVPLNDAPQAFESWNRFHEHFDRCDNVTNGLLLVNGVLFASYAASKGKVVLVRSWTNPRDPEPWLSELAARTGMSGFNTGEWPGCT
jgi:hypothetical protein